MQNMSKKVVKTEQNQTFEKHIFFESLYLQMLQNINVPSKV